MQVTYFARTVIFDLPRPLIPGDKTAASNSPPLGPKGYNVTLLSRLRDIICPTASVSFICRFPLSPQ